MRQRRFLWLLALLGVAGTALASERNHRYKDGEAVVLWVNKVGPFNNPQETYNYYALPYCKARPDEPAEHSWGGLGEVLQGNELIHSQLEIKFKGAPLPGGGWIGSLIRERSVRGPPAPGRAAGRQPLACSCAHTSPPPAAASTRSRGCRPCPPLLAQQYRSAHAP
jgi:hypothetical protein